MPIREGQMGTVVLHWMVQRDDKTGDLITFKSFADYMEAKRRKAELEAFADPSGRTNVVAVESLPVDEFPK
jgi:hypothetical protein